MQKKAVVWIMLMLFLSLRPGGAQDVRRGDLSGASSSRRRFENAAQKQGRSDFLASPYDGPGTQVRITFDPDNADVTLMTNRQYGLTRLLTDVQAVAHRLDRSRADYITVEGTKTATADIELNNYLRHQTRRTDFDLDLAALTNALKTLPLPAPVVIGIDAQDAESVTLTSATETKSLAGITFYGLNQVPPDARLHFAFTPLPYAAPVGIGLLALLLSAPLSLLRVATGRVKAPPVSIPPTPASLDPEELQRRYDRRKPLWLGNLFPLLLGLPFLLARGFNPGRLMLSWQMLCPVPIHLLMFGYMALMFLSIAATMLFARRRQAAVSSGGQTGEIGSSSDGGDSVPKPRVVMPWPLFMGPMLLMPITMLPLLFPVYTPQAAQTRRIVMLSMLGLVVVVWIALAAWWRRRLAQIGAEGGRWTLTEGVWYDMVQDMALRAGVKVKQVVLLTAALPNAYASIFGTVGLTTALVEQLEPEEVRAVIAHEIGHLKAKHPHRTFVGGLLVFALIWGGWEWLHSTLAPRLSERAADVFQMPFLFLVVSNLLMGLLLGPLRRRREREADRYAVQWIGDSELVIRALTKVSQGIGNPARLKRSDEALSSHPSLQNRIDAIRRGA